MHACILAMALDAKASDLVSMHRARLLLRFALAGVAFPVPIESTAIFKSCLCTFYHVHVHVYRNNRFT